MSIYRGPGGAGDAVADSSSEALLVRELAIEVQADADAAEAAKNAALAAQAAAELAETNAETAETNAETAETNAETAATAAASSASSASSSASAASTSATNAASSASAASTSASSASTSASNAASSASAASTSATAAASSASSASTSATNAASSATSASSSATTATTQATNASNSATAAATSATNAANSATSASTSASTATTQAGIATTQATNASNSASAAATSATNAANSASAASTSASNAATSATNAANSATSAASSATAAAASLDAFEDIYLGAKSSDPTLDNDGDALTVGDQYFNTVDNELKVWNGTTWQASSVVGGTVNSLTVTGAFSANGGTTLGDASGDALTINSSAVSIPNGLNFDSNTLVIDATNNFVGVGTSSPVVKLDVNGSFYVGYTASSQEIAVYNGDATNRQRIRLVMSGTDGVIDARRAAGTVPNMLFQIDGSERMRITSAGNVGIGTSSPVSVLDVAGTTPVITIKDTQNKSWAANDTVGDLDFYSSDTSGTGPRTVARIRSFADNTGTTAAGALSFWTSAADSAATEKMRLTKEGNLGLGVTPSAWGASYRSLDMFGGGSIVSATDTDSINIYANAYNNNTNWLYKATGLASSYRQNNGVHIWETAVSGTAGNTITFTEAMRINASGNVGIGTSSPGERLTVFTGANNSEVARFTGGQITRGLGISTFMVGSNNDGGARLSALDVLAFNTASTERMRIDSSGRLLVGRTSTVDSSKLTVENNDATVGVFFNTNASNVATVLQARATRNTTNNSFYAFTYYNEGAGADKLRIADSGNVTNTNNSYGAISDQKLKENIVDATPKLQDLCNVRVRNFNFIGSDEKQLGVIAQELETVFPSMVEEAPDRDAEGNDLGTVTKQVKYSVFVPMLIKAIQEQQAIITDLKARIETLESK